MIYLDSDADRFLHQSLGPGGLMSVRFVNGCVARVFHWRWSSDLEFIWCFIGHGESNPACFWWSIGVFFSEPALFWCFGTFLRRIVGVFLKDFERFENGVTIATKAFKFTWALKQIFGGSLVF